MVHYDLFWLCKHCINLPMYARADVERQVIELAAAVESMNKVSCYSHYEDPYHFFKYVHAVILARKSRTYKLPARELVKPLRSVGTLSRIGGGPKVCPI